MEKDIDQVVARIPVAEKLGLQFEVDKQKRAVQSAWFVQALMKVSRQTIVSMTRAAMTERRSLTALFGTVAGILGVDGGLRSFVRPILYAKTPR